MTQGHRLQEVVEFQKIIGQRLLLGMLEVRELSDPDMIFSFVEKMKKIFNFGWLLIESCNPEVIKKFHGANTDAKRIEFQEYGKNRNKLNS